MFKKLVDKVKAIFNKFIAWINSMTMDDKEFAKKYEAEIRKKWDKVKDTFSVKGYKFTNLNGNATGIQAGLDEIEKLYAEVALDKLKAMQGKTSAADLKSKYDTINDESNIMDKMRAAMAKAMVGSNDSELTDSEFTKALAEGFRDGESSKITLDKKDIEIEKCINELKTAAETKKAAEKAFKEIDTKLKQSIKDIEGLEKEVGKLKDLKDENTGEETLGSFSNLVSRVVTLEKQGREVAITANGAYLTALKDRSRQNKAILAAVVATGKVESAEYDDYDSYYAESSMDYLNNVVLK